MADEQIASVGSVPLVEAGFGIELAELAEIGRVEVLPCSLDQRHICFVHLLVGKSEIGAKHEEQGDRQEEPSQQAHPLGIGCLPPAVANAFGAGRGILRTGLSPRLSQRASHCFGPTGPAFFNLGVRPQPDKSVPFSD